METKGTKVLVRLVKGDKEVGSNLIAIDEASASTTPPTGHMVIDSAKQTSLEKLIADMHKAGLMCVSVKANSTKKAIDFVFAANDEEDQQAYALWQFLTAGANYGITAYNNGEAGWSMITFTRDSKKLRDEHGHPVKNEKDEDVWVPATATLHTIHFSLSEGFTLA